MNNDIIKIEIEISEEELKKMIGLEFFKMPSWNYANIMKATDKVIEILKKEAK